MCSAEPAQAAADLRAVRERVGTGRSTTKAQHIIMSFGEQAELLMKNNREYQIANEIGDLYKVGAIGNNCRQEARDMVFAAMVYV